MNLAPKEGNVRSYRRLFFSGSRNKWREEEEEERRRRSNNCNQQKMMMMRQQAMK